MTSKPLSCEQIEAQASEFIDDELPASERLSMDFHIAACADCRALIGDLTAIRDDAAALPVLAPSRDLWNGIEARIQPTILPFTAAPTTTAVPTRSGSGRTRLFIGGIAAALLGAVALGRWTATPSSAVSPAVVSAPNVASAVPVAPAESLPTVATSGQQAVPTGAPDTSPQVTTVATPVARPARPDARTTYQREIEALQTVMEEGDELLDPATRAIIESSLRTVDSAIAEARAALARDPRSGFLAEQLNKSLARKLGLLRTAALNSASL